MSRSMLFRVPPRILFAAVWLCGSISVTSAQEKPAEPANPPATAPADSPQPNSAPAEATSQKNESPQTPSQSVAPKPTQEGAKKETPKPEKKKQIRVLALRGSYEDLPAPGAINPTALLLGNGSGRTKSFFKLCDYLKELESEELATHVVFDLSDGSISLNSAQLDEFTRRLNSLRSKGKKCIAWLEDANNVHMAIAAACDEVIMADLGGVNIPSSTMETMLYRDAMDFFGVHASVVRAGDFKGAVEPYTNSVMSTHLKNHYLAMLDSINTAQVSRIAKGRGIPSGTVRELQKKRMLLPAEALSNHLVDKLAPYGSMKKTILDSVGDDHEWTKPKPKPKKELSIFELMGKAMAPPKDPSKLKEDAIVVLHLSGAIEDGKEARPGSIVSGAAVKSIDDLTADDHVRGVVVRINSPGGSATASEAIRQSLDKLAKKKPLVFSMGEVAASGGYWITCIGQPILAEHGTITGSIGVFSLKLSAGSLLRRVGVRVETIHLDSAAAMDSIDHAWTEEEIDRMQAFIDHIYTRFLQIGSESRKIPVDQLKGLAGGRVWSGEQAKANGLIDSIGGLDDAIAMVVKKSGAEKFKILHRPDAPTGIDLLQLLGERDEESDVAIGAIDVPSASMETLPATILSFLRQRGFRGDGTRTLLRWLESNENSMPKAWLLMPEEIRIR